MLREVSLPRVLEAIEILRSSEQGSKEYGDAHQLLFRVLEEELRQWVKDHPPGVADYDEASPDRAVYLYSDELDPSLRVDALRDILFFHLAHFGKLVKKTIKSMRTSSKQSEKDVVARAHPEYPDLLRQIREAKRAWTTEDKAIRQTHAFRMMGGLARLGSRAGAEYSRLVDRAQQMERSAIGRVLTVRTKVGR